MNRRVWKKKRYVKSILKKSFGDDFLSTLRHLGVRCWGTACMSTLAKETFVGGVQRRTSKGGSTVWALDVRPRCSLFGAHTKLIGGVPVDGQSGCVAGFRGRRHSPCCAPRRRSTTLPKATHNQPRLSEKSFSHPHQKIRHAATALTGKGSSVAATSPKKATPNST